MRLERSPSNIICQFERFDIFARPIGIPIKTNALGFITAQYVADRLHRLVHAGVGIDCFPIGTVVVSVCHDYLFPPIIFRMPSIFLLISFPGH